MSDDMKIDYYKLVRFINAVYNLVEGLHGDLKSSKKGTISNETVLNLANFHRAEKGIQSLLDSVELDIKQVN